MRPYTGLPWPALRRLSLWMTSHYPRIMRLGWGGMSWSLWPPVYCEQMVSWYFCALTYASLRAMGPLSQSWLAKHGCWPTAWFWCLWAETGSFRCSTRVCGDVWGAIEDISRGGIRVRLKVLILFSPSGAFTLMGKPWSCLHAERVNLESSPNRGRLCCLRCGH